MSGFDTSSWQTGKRVTGEIFLRLHLAMQLIDAGKGTKIDENVTYLRVGHKDTGHRGDEKWFRDYHKYLPDPDHPNRVMQQHGTLTEVKSNRWLVDEERPFLWREVSEGQYVFYHVLEERGGGMMDMSTCWTTT